MKLSPFSISLKTPEAVEIREIGPKDRRLLKSGFDHLSQQSRAFRFLSAHPRLSANELAQFTAPNDEDHFAIGALIETDETVTPLATARYIRLTPEGARAEFAETIIDDYQGLGLGGLMLGVLAKHAILNGISEFVALVHEENARMLGLLQELKAVATNPHDTEIELLFPLFEDPRGYPDTRVGDAFRTAYRLARMI